MKKYTILLWFFYPSTIFAQQVDVASISNRIVNEAVIVKPGELVYVQGSIEAAPFVESVIAAYDKMGAHAFSEQSNAGGYTADMAQVLILIHGEERVIQKESLVQSKAKRQVRILHVTYPTRSFAERMKLNFDMYNEMMLKALSFDYNIQNNNINRLKHLLENSQQVRITTQEGTDFSFMVNKRPIVVSDGRISKDDVLNTSAFNKEDQLPAGIVEVSILETSAVGHVVIPHAECNAEPMTDVTFDFVRGKVENFKAKEGADCFTKNLDRYEGPKDMIGSISFGANTELKPIEEDGGLYWPRAGVAILYLTIGGNQLLGGKNPSSCGQFSFPILWATIEMDGKVVLKSVKH